MNKLQHICLIFLSIFYSSSYIEPIFLLTANAATQSRKPHRFTPSRIGAPTIRFAAGRRGLCESSRMISSKVKGEDKLIALIPEGELSLTSNAAPVIFFYIPPICARVMRFSLTNMTTAKTYNVLLKTPISSGIIALPFSDLKNFPGLETGKEYQWELRLVTNPRDTSADLSVAGRLQRKVLSQNLSNALKDATPSDRLNLYADNSFWFETVAAIIETRHASPPDNTFNENWKSLLQSVSLDTLVSQPFVSNFVSVAVPE
jgi:hypothetical protein